ncbi:hypothetical protein LUZ60_003817 [Juncus effusus]|nr:hypothetical protein LUZ60_003817 [Juncus effusus]
MAEDQYSDPILDYISRILLEEEVDENFNGNQQAPDLHDIEKPFYDILEQKYSPNSPEKQPISTHLETNPYSADSPSINSSPESRIESLSSLEFQRGLEEGMKFLPIIDKLALDLQANKIENDISSINLIEEEERRGNKGKKNSGMNMDLLEGKNRKLPMLYYEEPIRDDTFDQALLYHGENYEREEISSLNETMRSKANRRDDKESHIDLWDLLVSCANSIAINDHKIACSHIKEIRKHASPNGDGTQRLAFAFVNALEARLAGCGSEAYRHLVSKRTSITDTLKSYHLYIKASPLLRVSYCFANNCILHAMNKSSKIHIIDLGIDFGFQWPSLIQSIANNRKGEISKLRFTGVGFPQMGFRPAERVEENGRRLKNYAESFNVPFEYQGIASKWEEIRIEDLKIEKDELLIVNSMYQFRRVKDETFGLDSPRNHVLNLIRRINPRIFIHGVFNATYSPFFVTRFRQVLLHYSSVFDMLDTRVPRDNKYRELIEQGILARDIMNIVACEGSEWIYTPETYKQWHVRNLRAGFEPVPIEPDILKVCKEKVRNFYDNRFFIEEDGNWLLSGWRGRVNYGLSVWKPKLE